MNNVILWKILSCVWLLTTIVKSQSYDDQNWGGKCSSGSRQSPINIKDFKGACDNSIKLDLKLEANTLNIVIAQVDPLKYISLTLDEAETKVFSYLYASDLTGNIYGYNFSEMRLHAPAEHKIESQEFSIEVQLHFVLRPEFISSSKNKKAVMSLLFKETEDKKINVDFLTLFSKTEPQTDINLVQLLQDTLPSPLSYFTYEGSDTVPTCEEDVLWYLVEAPIEVSPSQTSIFNTMFKDNAEFTSKGAGSNRNIQAFNDRSIKKGGVE